MEDITNRLIQKRFPFESACDDFAKELPRINKGQVVGLSICEDCFVLVYSPFPGVLKRTVCFDVPHLGGYSLNYFLSSFGRQFFVGSYGLIVNPHLAELLKGLATIMKNKATDGDILLVSDEEKTDTCFSNFGGPWFSFKNRHGFYLVGYNNFDLCLFGVNEAKKDVLLVRRVLVMDTRNFSTSYWQVLPIDFGDEITSLPFRISSDNLSAVPVTTRSEVVWVDLRFTESGRVGVVKRSARTSIRVLGDTTGQSAVLRDSASKKIIIVPKTSFQSAVRIVEAEMGVSGAA